MSMSLYDWMKLAAALRLLLRTSRSRQPTALEKDVVANMKPSAADLLDWHPRIRREPDPRQPSLPL